MLSVPLAVVAFLAGVAGTWSPCGFSMVDTISAPRRHTGASCASFACGTCAGGAITFVLLAVIGSAIRSAGGFPTSELVAAIALAAAVAEARTLPIGPQIRRQVPESWRRVLPLPLAAAMYGVLLGLGFTTFVLTSAFWALTILTLLVAPAQLGLLIGIAFGAGRALPVVAIAPVAQRAVGRRLLDAMAQRPAALSWLRRVEALALVTVALASAGVTGAGAATLGPGSDPSVAGTTVVWTSSAGGIERDEAGGPTTSVPAHATVGGSMIAWRDGETVHVAHSADLSEVLALDVPGLDAIAVSDSWLVTRAHDASGGDTLAARPLATPEDVRVVATTKRSAQLGRPAIDGRDLLYHVASAGGSRIVQVNLATSRARVVRRATGAQLVTNPSVLGDDLVYDRQTQTAQLVEIGPIDFPTRDRVVLRFGAPAPHDAGHEPGYSPHTRTPHPAPSKWLPWTTALSAARVYVTLLPRGGSASGARLVSAPRS